MTDKPTTLGFGLATNAAGVVVVREGTLRKEQRVEVDTVIDPLCPCDRAFANGDGLMCWACTGPQTIRTVDHTDGDL